MMDLPQPNAERDAEILALADAHVHGTLSAEMAARLEHLVVHDAVARQVYVEYLQDSYHLHRLAVHALADEEVASGQWLMDGEEWGEEEERESNSSSIPNLPPPVSIILDNSSPLPSPLTSIPSFVGSWTFANLFSLFVISLGLLGAWFYQIEIPRSIAHGGRSRFSPANLPEDHRALAYVGRITGMVDCKGVGSSAQKAGNGTAQIRSRKLEIRNYQPLVTLGDQFTLTSGLLEITYDTGAKVILQGPCDYKVESRDGGFLSIGKLTARLEKKGSEKVASGQWLVASEINPKSANPKSQISNPQSLIPNPSSAPPPPPHPPPGGGGSK